MKKTVVILTLLTLSPCLHASQACQDESFGYRPQAETLKEAAGTFGFVAEHEISACAVQAKIKVSKDQAISILGYETLKDGGKEIHYRIDNFKNGYGTTEDDCRVQTHLVVTGKPNWDSMTLVVSDPVCVSSPAK